MNINNIVSRAEQLCSTSRENNEAIKYAFSYECMKSYEFNNKTKVSSIRRVGFNMQNFIIEFKIGNNILYIDRTDELSKEFLELIKSSNKVIVCNKAEDIFNAPRGVIFLDENSDSEELSNNGEFIIGSQSILIACTDITMPSYYDCINFEFDGQDYISKVKQ